MKHVSFVSLILWKSSLVYPFYLFHHFPLFLCIDHWGRHSYLSFFFFGTLHSNGYIFPFLLCLYLLFFPQLIIRFPQATIFPFCISFSWGWSWLLQPVQCHEPHSTAFQALWSIICSIELNMFYWTLCFKITENDNDNLLLNVRNSWLSFVYGNTTFLLAWTWIFDINILGLFSIPIFHLKLSNIKNRQHLGKTYSVL